MNKVAIFLLSLAILFSITSFNAQAMNDGNNVNFHGVLVHEPCVIPAGEENIKIDFGTIEKKSLYTYSRSIGVPFVIHLKDCDTKVANTVTSIFSGTESNVLPGFLAIESGSGAGGIAIGLETPDGTELKLNTAMPKQTLSQGENFIRLDAYVLGEPKALSDKTLKDGAFWATATFTLVYE